MILASYFLLSLKPRTHAPWPPKAFHAWMRGLYTCLEVLLRIALVMLLYMSNAAQARKEV